MKQDTIKSIGEVLSELGNSFFKVILDSGQELLCTISGKIRKNRIRIMAGDKVEVEMSPYDLTKGRISRRLKTINLENLSEVNNNIKLKNKKK